MKPQKRLYKSATVTGEGPFGIALDGRPLKTPFKRSVILENAELAQCIAAEWQAQKSYVAPARMMFTSLAFSAIDHVSGARERTIDDIARFAASDLVCYRAFESAGLVERQAAHWDPIVIAAREMFGVEFVTTQGINFKQQPSEALKAVVSSLESRSPFQLAAIHYLTLYTGSALIALALAHKHLTADAAWIAAHVDEDWQIEQWGQDPEARASRDTYRSQFDGAVEFLRLASNC